MMAKLYSNCTAIEEDGLKSIITDPPSNSAEIVAGLPNGGGIHEDLVGLEDVKRWKFALSTGTLVHTCFSMAVKVPVTSGAL
jgi:hypothetical protein